MKYKSPPLLCSNRESMRFNPVPCAALIVGSLITLLPAQTAGDTGPSLIYREEPEYSAEATRARVQSTVTLGITVGEDGRAHDIHVTEGAGFGLDEKAIEAMDKWRFNPATKDGHPAAVPANIEMNFTILAKNDKVDHSGQRARLNFTLPPGAMRPELIVGQLPGNPVTPDIQSVSLHLQVDAQGVPKNVTALHSTDPVWEKQVMRVVQTWRFEAASVDGNGVAVEGVFELAHSGASESPGIVLANPTVSEEPPSPVLHTRPSPAPVSIPGFIPRSEHTATVLPNGTVLLAGGKAASHAIDSAQIFDWATRKIVDTTPMLEARYNFTATLLRNGTVLIAGGHGKNGQPLASAEIFDPSTGKFSATGSMQEPREGQSAIALTDGRVLVCGGFGAAPHALDSAEIYNPATKTFTPIGRMTETRAATPAVNLKDGHILLLGFNGGRSSAEIFDPASGIFEAAVKTATPRYTASQTMLPNGKVLIAGGSREPDSPVLNTAELYDPLTRSFEPTGAMMQPRSSQVATLLANGKVLLSAGISKSPGAPLTSTEIYDPSTGSFAAGPELNGHHFGQTATLLQDGSVLIAGSGLECNDAAAELLVIN